ncbi:hypothetical protein G6F60_015295 [Rhizopus arrhizus]|nr:hypothetical protein G6F60_015295 [Rhizopus arrhizus]
MSSRATRVRSERSALLAEAALRMPGRHAAAGGGTPVAAQVLHAGRVRTIAVLGAPPAAQVACAGRAGTVALPSL